MLLTETWTNEFSDVSVAGFKDFQINRLNKKQNTKRDSGGIALFVRDKLIKHCKLFEKDGDDIIWLKIDKHLFHLSSDLYLCLCYVIPSNSSREAFTEISILDRISQNIVQIANETNDKYNIMLCGDFNSRTASEQDFVIFDNDVNLDLLPSDYEVDNTLPRFSQDRIINTNGRKLLEFCKLNGLRIGNGRIGLDYGVGQYTYIGSTGSSLIDYVIVTPSLLDCFTSFQVCEPNIISDHCAVEFSLSSRREIDHARPIETGSYESKRKKYVCGDDKGADYKLRLDIEEAAFSALNIHLAQAVLPQDIEQSIDKFANLMSKICDPLFPKYVGSPGNKSIPEERTKKQPWFDDECLKFRNDFYTALNVFRSEKNLSNQKKLVDARANFKRVIRQKRYNYNREKTNNLISLKYKNAKQYWKLLKQAANLNDKHTISSEQFAEYFKAVNDPNDRFYQADEDIIQFNERYNLGELQVIFDELNLAISTNEIKVAIKQLRNGASAGPDLFLNEFFKNGSDSLICYLQNLFNKIFELGYFPEKWAEGFIIPIFKKGDKNDVTNYRGITLLSTLGKLFTRILNNKLNNWAEEYYVYVEAQAGFRKNMGTVDNIFILSGLITHILNNNDSLFCAFIDFTKAFDFVVRDILWYKLLKIGVRGKMIDIIKSMYNIVKSQVKIENTLSEAFTCNIGVRQGECLSPFLFSMYLNDLEEELITNGVNGIDIGMLKLFLLLYADDIVFLAKHQRIYSMG